MGVQFTQSSLVGGIFERLIKSVKRCLHKIVGQARLTYDEMTTALVEVEAVINSRPLTYVAMDDLDEPLTHSHLLTIHRISSLPDNTKPSKDDEEFILNGHSQLIKRARHLNHTLNIFWNRWQREYLLELREAYRYYQGSSNATSVKVGDVVVIHSSEQQRAFWKLGRVVEQVRGRDGEIRGATLKTAGKGRRATTLHRPIQQLFPLETVEESDESELSGTEDVGEDNVMPEKNKVDPKTITKEETRRRPSRIAAQVVRDRLLTKTLADN